MGCFHRGQLRLEPPHLTACPKAPSILDLQLSPGETLPAGAPGGPGDQAGSRLFLHWFCSHLQLNEPKLLGVSGSHLFT